ncbi:translocation/assembly module TamB domain-containing protein [Aphanothece sacrum]|uniref:Translocation and assembly module TamB C-terminal domain-containing protein n=1 Tax=Aphanothece sacrum FPU1 TaxID=1920663 RepID=A0A401IE71_APHSA|nr:translocation/assembly module TamB domain-containing protein [Aphanothece sacrum]GBF79575.1 hypothetical protein AsFPU1_0971 [Aphanothece sacrum FPU1]GBF87034.1 hypothetical protein AsFPU3_4113 [Aphanothece sacrum FPU3]
MITDRSQRKRETKLLLPLVVTSKPKPKSILSHRSLIWWGTGVLMVGLGGSCLTGWFWVQRHLSPLVEAELSNFLNRPVKMGSVEYFSLGQVNFGETKISTTPTDKAQVSMKGLRVSYNPLKLLLKQKLDIVVTAIEPDIYLEQGTKGNWLLTEFDPVNANHPVALKSLRLKNAKTIVVARGNNGQKNSPVTLQNLSSQTDFINNNQEIKFEVNANLTQGGQFNVSGVAKPTTGNTNLLVRGNGLKVSEVGNLFALPVILKSGELDTNLEVSLRSNQLPLLRGIGTLHQVTAKVSSLPHTVQTTGELRFKETEINFNQVATNFGAINSIVSGTIDLRKGYNITAQTKPITISNLFKTLNHKPPKVALSGEIKSTLQVTGSIDKPNFDLGVATTKPTQVDRVNFKQINAQLNFNNHNLFINNIQAFPTIGGKINGTGKLSLTVKNAPKFDLNIQGENVPTTTLVRLYNVTLPLEIGTTNAQINLSGIVNKPDSLQGQGKADFQVAGGTIQSNNISISQGSWQGILQAENINLKNLNVSLPDKLNQGKLAGTFNVSGQVKLANINNIKADGNAKLVLNQGHITANNLQLSQGNWQTNLGIQGIKFKEILPTVPQNLNGNINGNLVVSGKINNSLENIKAKGKAGLDLEKGQIQASNINLTDGKWSTQLSTSDIPITQLFTHSPPTLNGTLNSQLNLSGNVTGSLDSIQGQGIAKLAISQGIITAQKITLNQGKFITILSPQNIDLKKISANLTGKLNGNVTIIGQLDKLNPENLQAKGQLNFSQGIPSIRQTLTTNFNWNGQRLTLENIKSLGLSAQGWAEVEKTDKLPQIKGFFLEIAAKSFDLTALPLDLSSVIPNLNYSGKMDFEGTVTGTPKTPTIEGKLALINLKVGELQFEPVLTGNIAGEPTQGVKLALAGRNDQLNLELAKNWQPVTFSIKQGQQSVTGIRQTQEFQVEAKQISLDFLQNLAKTITKTQNNLVSSNYLLSQPVSGELSGKFVWDIQTGAITGKQVAIANPVVGTLKGKEFTGNIHYGNGSVTLKNGQWQAKNSQYQLNGQFTSTANGPLINAEVAINQGNLQDILETLQIFDLDDLKRGLTPPVYGKAADLYGNASPNSPLIEVGKADLNNRLDYFKRFSATWDEDKKNRKKTAPLPELRELQGEFTGQVALKMTPQLGIQANFDLQGQQWKWGQYQIDQMTAKGDWTKGKLTLEPVSVQVGNSLVGFAGQITEKTQKGELTVQNISLEKISDLLAVPPPLNFGGQLNATLTLGGSRENPQGRGKLVIDQASINETSLNSTQGEFIYSEGRFNFSVHSVLGRRTNPLTLEGTFPYQLPFAKVKPKNDNFALKFQAQNEDLSLLNVLTKGQVAWLGGQGEVQLNVSGKVEPKWGIPYELEANGIAWVENATIAAQMMPQAPLTKVQGKIFLNLDRLTVESLTGQFSGGKVAVTGSLPLLQSIPETNPLTIQFDDLALNLPQRYRGGVTGFLNITGSALTPKIGGNIGLFEGEIFLGDEKEENKNQGELLAKTEFADLRLTLGENIVVSRPPILNFLATGSLTVNGTLNKPLPEGIINLNSGLINLFATQLRLAGGKDNTAQFFSEKGLDPYLNVRLFTAATETSRNRVNINPNSAEINEPFSANSDSLQTVRIQAYVKGYASQLTDKIELTSQPQRTPEEIITLLGGNFLNTLGQGETTLGLANLAGTAVLGAVQGAIGEALGLNEFRIFPTTLINEKDLVDSSSLGVAAEAGVDLTNNLSLSIQKILNTDRPPELGIKYRINKSTTIRGSSNFSNDSRGSIQFERRF